WTATAYGLLLAERLPWRGPKGDASSTASSPRAQRARTPAGGRGGGRGVAGRARARGFFPPCGGASVAPPWSVGPRFCPRAAGGGDAVELAPAEAPPPPRPPRLGAGRPAGNTGRPTPRGQGGRHGRRLGLRLPGVRRLLRPPGALRRQRLRPPQPGGGPPDA